MWMNWEDKVWKQQVHLVRKQVLGARRFTESNQRQDCLRHKLLVRMMKTFETRERERESLHNLADTPNHR